MEATTIILTVMLGFAGVLLLLLGYLTRKNQDPTGISLPNLDLSKIKDKKGFAIFVGTHVMLIGVFCISAGVFVFTVPRLTLLALVLFMFLVITMSFRLVILHKKFEQF